MELTTAMKIAVSGLKVQTHRMDIIAENLANASSVAEEPGAQPYRRREPRIFAAFDHVLGAEVAKAGREIIDKSPPRLDYQPHHPVANEDGYVEMPNVNPLIEIADMRDAQRSYEANLNLIKTSQQMIRQAIGILRS